jgi:hypothetical protein
MCLAIRKIREPSHMRDVSPPRSASSDGFHHGVRAGRTQSRHLVYYLHYMQPKNKGDVRTLILLLFRAAALMTAAPFESIVRPKTLRREGIALWHHDSFVLLGAMKNSSFHRFKRGGHTCRASLNKAKRVACLYRAGWMLADPLCSDSL